MNRLKDLRREMGLSQQALADKLNVSQQTICKYENNTNEPEYRHVRSHGRYF